MTTTPNTLHNGKGITRDHLKQMVDRKANFKLIEVLDADKYKEFHLPGAINVPFNDQFETAVTVAVPDKNAKIVVYCGDKACDASAKAAQKLVALGYTRVRDFEEGKKAWLQTPTKGPPKTDVNADD